MPAPFDLSPLVPRIVKFREERDWGQFHQPKELATGLAIEAAELQEEFLWKASESAPEVAADKDRLDRIKAEIADISIYILMLANDLEIDLQDAITDKLGKNALRYPVDKVRGRADKAPQ